MILEFSVENFRSIKSRQVLSLVAESSKAKGENVFLVPLPNDNSLRLLKTALIYGANGSGKSNLIRALETFMSLVRSRNAGAGRPIRGYDPFIFSQSTQDQPTIFELVFIFENIKYGYSIAFNRTQITHEELTHWPKGQSHLILERIIEPNEPLHKIKLGKNFGNKEIEIFSNQLGLNKFGTDTPHKALTKLYLFLRSIEIGNTARNANSPMQMRRTLQRFIQPEKGGIVDQLGNLLKVADTKIESIRLEPKEITIDLEDNLGEPFQELRTINEIYAFHKTFEDGKETGYAKLEINEESEGTKILFWRGRLILEKLQQGGVLIFDELDNSLHPKLVRLLVLLFTNPRSNPKNAQLIFATHEVTLLDRDLFRTDQIWFTEKNQFGETQLFSAQDFDGVREDVPFDKWYLAGKFGGLPKFEDIETIFNHA